MIRCYFIGHDYIYDEGLDKKLAAELEKLVQLDDEIEFWFYTNIPLPYMRLCIALSVWLRTKYPHKQIEIIYALDILDSVQQTEDYTFQIDAYFPRCIANRTVCIPLVNKYAREKFSCYVDQVERYIIKQCDTVFVYCYPYVEKRVYNQSRCTKKETIVIQLSFAETEAFIQEMLPTVVNPFHQAILELLAEGELTHVAIAQMLGLSPGRVGRIAHETGRKMRKVLRTRIQEKQPVRVSIIALNPPTTADQLVMFECMLAYLIKEGSTEFWIDETSVAIYKDILNEAITKNVKAINEKTATPNCLVKTFACTPQDYRAVVKKSQWVLTDYSHELAETIKTLCCEDGQTMLIDIASDKRRIETLPL